MCATISPVLRGSVVLVFLAALAVLGWDAAKPGIATAYVDPIEKIQAQDEGYYGSISFEMAKSFEMGKSGDWLMPRFLDRYALTKPPLLYWLQATAVKMTGRKPIALRLPSILAGAATVAIVYTWLLGEGAPLAAAIAASLLLLSSHLFFVLSRIGLTDALLTFETTLAMFTLVRDPQIKSRAGLWTFGVASGAAILTKGIAGLFPLLALVAFCAISGRRPQWTKVAQVVAISAAVAAPWHVYQLVRHTRWFWAEYVLTEIVTFGSGAPPQTTAETQAGYYFERLALMDAPLLAAAVLALFWKRPPALIAWLLVVLVAALNFDYRNATYLAPLLPALALLVGGAISPKWSRWALAAAVLLFVGKALAPGKPWGIPFGAESKIPAEQALDRYASLKRGNELIIGSPADGFYSACLDLARVRYLYLDPSTERRRYALDFEELGITMTASDFLRLPDLRPAFEQRLRDWGLDRGDPIATVILAPNMDQVGTVIRSHPEADFLLPATWAAQDDGIHSVVDAGSGLELLFSREVIQRP